MSRKKSLDRILQEQMCSDAPNGLEKLSVNTVIPSNSMSDSRIHGIYMVCRHHGFLAHCGQTVQHLGH